MNRITSIFFVLLFALSAMANNSVPMDEKKENSDDPAEVKDVEVYYFHATRRCVTCKAVGRIAQELVEAKYNEQVNFIKINIDEDGNEELIEKLQVTGSRLYVYNGEEFVNITAYAFQYAISNPDKLKNKLIQLINRNL